MLPKFVYFLRVNFSRFICIFHVNRFGTRPEHGRLFLVAHATMHTHTHIDLGGEVGDDVRGYGDGLAEYTTCGVVKTNVKDVK